MYINKKGGSSLVNQKLATMIHQSYNNYSMPFWFCARVFLE